MKLFAALACTAALALSATGASAAVVCNDEATAGALKSDVITSRTSSSASMMTTGSGRTARSTVGAIPEALGTDTIAEASGSASIDFDGGATLNR